MSNRKSAWGLIAVAILLSLPVASAQTGDKVIIVNIQRQRLIAWEGKTQALALGCMTGRINREITPGTFRVLRKEERDQTHRWRSPTPFALVLAEDGQAIHASEFASERNYDRYMKANEAGGHGGVGLSAGDGAKLFEWADPGTRVEILPFGRKFLYRYNDGTGVWEHGGKDEWIDSHPSGKKYAFRVASQTDQYLELVDRAREVRVRLHADGRNQHAQGSSRFDDAPRGIWVDD